MTPRSATGRSLLLAGTFAGLCATAWPATAQQPAAPATPAAPAPAAQAPTPPPTWQQGRSENVTEGMTKLAPVAPPPIPTAVDKLPIAKLKLPKGFKIEVYASGVANARTLRLGDKGTVFVSSRLQDKVHAIVDKDGKREVKVIASGLYRPNGIALHNGTLYIAELYQDLEDREDRGQPRQSAEAHRDLRRPAEGRAARLEVSHRRARQQALLPGRSTLQHLHAVGCARADPPHQSRRHGRWKSYARGIRQIVGMDWHPVTKQLYFTENSRDWLSEDIPEDKLNRVAQPGKDNFGYPYCHQGNFPIRNSAGGARATSSPSRSPCSGRMRPRSACGSTPATCSRRNTATRSSSPATARGTGREKFGGDVVDRQAERGWHRASRSSRSSPASSRTTTMSDARSDVLVMKDGSLLVSDDYNGAVYRVSYGSGGVAGR